VRNILAQPAGGWDKKRPHDTKAATPRNKKYFGFQTK